MSAVSHMLRSIFSTIRHFFSIVLSIKEGVDSEATIEGIKKDITFRGPAAWILMFSILIASIGLNVNSIAVIIGAMLISPLMGPILGVGLSVSINDQPTLVRSLKNLGVAVIISLVTSTIYFALTPLDFAQSELLNRTRPTILDVMVALFGGFAGIIAGSKKEKSNVVPGVAIATALMPPLCTAGYGLANLNLTFFLGAFYLFFINSVFIALSTYLVVRYLGFPKITFMDPLKARKYRIGITLFLFVTIFPSVIIFWNVIQETRYEINAERFINEKCNFQGSELISKKITYNDTGSVIDLYYIGSRIDMEKQRYLDNMLDDYKISGTSTFSPTKKTYIVIHQERDDQDYIQEKMETMNEKLRVSVLQDLYAKNEALIKDKDQKILLLEEELSRMKNMGIAPMDQLKSEINFHFKDIEMFSFGNVVQVSGKDNLKLDTIPSLMVHFSDKTSSRTKKEEISKVHDWLKVRFKKDKVQVVEY